MPANTLAQSDSHHPSPAASIGARTHLPMPLTPFIGRESELAGAVALLTREDVRLLTLTGPGGAGKTRLAIEIATLVEPEFPDGIYFLELAPISDPGDLIPTIAREFHVLASGGESPQSILHQLLGERRMLLVLDNFDQIVAAAPAVAQLLANCPRLKVLTTSRIVLNIQGEHEFPVPPLSLPESGPGRTWRNLNLDELNRYDAIQLFVQRARAARPDFEISEGNGLAIVNVCRRLDGLPLAIELAAARTKILSPEALLTRLSRSLDILSGGARNLPPRLQTMRAAIAWSYELLEPEEQELFQQIAVFAGGFTLEAAEAVCGDKYDVLSGIATLTNNSLLRRIELTDATPRFLMLETVREFGIEQLQEGEHENDARSRHADWVCESMGEIERRMFGPEASALLDRFEVELENIRATLRWLIAQGSIDTGLQLANACAFCWFYRSYFIEARDWFEQLRQRSGPEPSPWLALALCFEGLLNQALSNFPRSLELTEQSLSMAQEVGDQKTAAIATYHLGDVLDTMGEFEQAESYFTEALTMFREQNDRLWLSMLLSLHSLVVHRRGDTDRAQEMVAEGLTFARETGFAWAIAICLNRQGRFASDAGDFASAAPLYQESLRIWEEFGDRWRVTRTLPDIADSAAMLGWPDRAAVLLGAAEALNEPLATTHRFADDFSWRRARTEAMTALDPETFERLWAEGRSMSWDEAVAASLETLVATEKHPATKTSSETSESPLSPRELEVLQLLVDGLTDREIAEVLFISPRTAQGHVSNIFNKLGVNSRTAAVATALQSELLPKTESPEA